MAVSKKKQDEKNTFDKLVVVRLDENGQENVLLERDLGGYVAEEFEITADETSHRVGRLVLRLPAE